MADGSGGTSGATTGLGPLRLRIAELEGAVESAKRSESKWQLTAELLPTAMVMVNDRGEIVLINAQAEKLFGYAREELVGQIIEILVPERFRQTHSGYRRAFFARPEARAMGAGRDLFGLRKDGSEFPIEIGLNPIQTEDGNFVISAIVDITERRRAQERFRHAVESAPNAMVMVDSSGNIVLVNEQTERLFLYSREELLGQKVDILVPARYRAKHPAYRESFFANPQIRSMGSGRDLYGERKDGSEFPIEIGLNPIETEEGRFVLSAIIDITERRRSEAALRDRTQVMRLTADVGLAVNRTGSVREMLQECAASMVTNLDAAFARVWILIEETNVLELEASAGLYTHINGAHARVPVGAFKIGKIAEERRPHLTNDVLTDPRVGDKDWARREGMVSFAGYPLLIDDRLVGVMAIFARRPLAQPILDAMGTVANQVAAGIERKRSEETLRLTQFSINQVTTAVFWTDADGRFFNVNEAACRLSGYSRHELISLSVSDVDPSITPEVWKMIWAEMQRRGFLSMESKLRRKDGKAVPISVSGNSLQIDGRAFSCTFVQDISERRNAEEVQRQSEIRYQAISNQLQLQIDRMPLAYVVFNSALRIVDWNPAAQVIFGYSRDEAIEMTAPFETLVPKEAREKSRELLARIRSGDMTAHSVTENLTKFGQTITCEWINTPLLADNGTFNGLMCLVQDITERMRLETQFRQAQKMEAIGQLAGGVAHDFNNLLTIILGYSDILKESFEFDAANLELVEQIHSAGSRAARLTRQLLAFSRKQVLAPVVLDLNILLTDMTKMIARLIGEDIDLALVPAGDLWKVRVDAGQMEQVLMNLVVNARDAMPRGGKLTIETANIELDEEYSARQPDAPPGFYAVMAVSDSGCGMDAPTKARIFEPFFSTKGDKGTGLGLATVYGIVKQSGGHIAVYTEPHQGTSFKIYLPRHMEETPRARASSKSKANLQGTETILLVEDEEGVRSLARMTLMRHGYKVLEASNGAEALRICEEHREPIELLATDVVMPGMSGRELADALQPLRPTMRVLYMSGYMDDAIVRHGLVHAGVPFLQKPYTPASLAAKVRDILNRLS